MENSESKDEKLRIQWHDAFVAAMKLELKEYVDYITFNPEYELTGRPKYIDLVMVKKPDIVNEAGFVKLFSEYNVLDYKGVGDKLDVDTVVKGVAYTCMYMTEQSQIHKMDKTVNKYDDITLTFVRESKPVKLLKYLGDHNCTIVKSSDGVYNINVTQLFCVQIIVIKEIEFDDHPWLSALTKKLDEDQARMLIELEKNMSSNWEHNNAEEVMDAAITANRDVFRALRGGGEDMCKAMWDLMKPDIDAYVEEKIAEKNGKIAEQNGKIAEQDKLLAEKDAEIERLNGLLAKYSYC